MKTLFIYLELGYPYDRYVIIFSCSLIIYPDIRMIGLFVDAEVILFSFQHMHL